MPKKDKINIIIFFISKTNSIPITYEVLLCKLKQTNFTQYFHDIHPSINLSFQKDASRAFAQIWTYFMEKIQFFPLMSSNCLLLTVPGQERASEHGLLDEMDINNSRLYDMIELSE